MTNTKAPLDLLLIATLAVLCTVGYLVHMEISALVRAASACLLILILPGYAFQSALFPQKLIGTIERTLIGVAFAIMVTAGVGLALNGLHVRLVTNSWAIALGGITVIACIVAGIRRARMSNTQSARPFDFGISWGHGLLFALAGVITVGVIHLSAMPLTRTDTVQGYTILWMLPADTTSSPAAVRLGVNSNEFTPTSYILRIIVDQKVVREWSDIQLAPGQEWTATYELPSDSSSLTRVDAVLSLMQSPYAGYRKVHVYPGSYQGVFHAH